MQKRGFPFGQILVAQPLGCSPNEAVDATQTVTEALEAESRVVDDITRHMSVALKNLRHLPGLSQVTPYVVNSVIQGKVVFKAKVHHLGKFADSVNQPR